MVSGNPATSASGFAAASAEILVRRAEPLGELHPQAGVIAFARRAQDLVEGVLQQVMRVVALQERDVS